MKIKGLILWMGLVLALTGASYISASAQVTANYQITISRTGADLATARRNLLDALGSFAESLPGASDIYQRLQDGSLDLDNQGRPKFDRAKVEARIISWLETQIDNADVSARARVRKETINTQIDQEELDALKDRKPAVIEAAPVRFSTRPIRSPRRPTRRGNQ